MLASTKWGALSIILVLFLLLVSLRPPWIAWDKYDSSIHGKKIKFTTDMIYVPLSKEHLRHGYSKEEIKLERILLVHDSYAYHAFNYNITDNNREILPTDKEYVIERSYWRKSNWLVRIFNSNLRYALLKDDEGTYSIVSFFEFIDSTEKQLADTNFIYKEK